MSLEMLEKKLEELTQREKRLEAKMRPVAKPAWRNAVGTMKDDELSREAERLGAEWRAKMNAEGT